MPLLSLIFLSLQALGFWTPVGPETEISSRYVRLWPLRMSTVIECHLL